MYFNSLPHEKKINLKYNVYNHLGWGIARHIAEGEYVVYFSNDAVATLRSHGFIYAFLRNYNSFEHTMERLPNAVSFLVYDTIMPIDGRRIFPIERLIEALQKKISASSVIWPM